MLTQKRPRVLQFRLVLSDAHISNTRLWYGVFQLLCFDRHSCHLKLACKESVNTVLNSPSRPVQAAALYSCTAGHQRSVHETSHAEIGHASRSHLLQQLLS